MGDKPVVTEPEMKDPYLDLCDYLAPQICRVYLIGREDIDHDSLNDEKCFEIIRSDPYLHKVIEIIVDCLSMRFEFKRIKSEEQIKKEADLATLNAQSLIQKLRAENAGVALHHFNNWAGEFLTQGKK